MQMQTVLRSDRIPYGGHVQFIRVDIRFSLQKPIEIPSLVTSLPCSDIWRGTYFRDIFSLRARFGT